MNSDISNINRREFIKKMSLMLGAVSGALLSDTTLANALAFNSKVSNEQYIAKLLNQTEFAVLAAITDAVLPETDTPSGSALGCHEFIDHQLLACHTQIEQQNCLTIINKIDHTSLSLFKKSFTQLPPNQQHNILVDLEKTKSFTSDDKANWHLLKSLIVFGYFTTDIGATVVLNYQAVPGKFIGSIPYDETSKAWGSLGFY